MISRACKVFFLFFLLSFFFPGGGSLSYYGKAHIEYKIRALSNKLLNNTSGNGCKDNEESRLIWPTGFL